MRTKVKFYLTWVWPDRLFLLAPNNSTSPLLFVHIRRYALSGTNASVSLAAAQKWLRFSSVAVCKKSHFSSTFLFFFFLCLHFISPSTKWLLLKDLESDFQQLTLHTLNFYILDKHKEYKIAKPPAPFTS